MNNPESETAKIGRTWPDALVEWFSGTLGWTLGAGIASLVAIFAYSVLFLDECRNLGVLGTAGPCQADVVRNVKKELLSDPAAVQILKGERGVDVQITDALVAAISREISEKYISDFVGHLSDDVKKEFLEHITSRFSEQYKTLTSRGQVLTEGAVVAFNSEVCPHGWRQFDEGEGRFVLGATRNGGAGEGTAVFLTASGERISRTVMETGGDARHIPHRRWPDGHLTISSDVAVLMAENSQRSIKNGESRWSIDIPYTSESETKEIALQYPDPKTKIENYYGVVDNIGVI